MECTVTYKLSNKALDNAEVRFLMKELEDLIEKCNTGNVEDVKVPSQDKGVPHRIINSVVDYMKFYNEAVNKTNASTTASPQEDNTEGVPFKLMKSLFEHMVPTNPQTKEERSQDDIISALHSLGIKL